MYDLSANDVPDGQPDEQTLNLGVLEGFLGFRLRRLHNRMVQSFGQVLSEFELRPGEFASLALIAANPGVAQVDVARIANFDKASVVALVDDLERRGWAERRRSAEDRRRHSLYATRAGEAALDQLMALARKHETWITDALEPDERAQLISMIDRLYVRLVEEEPR